MHYSAGALCLILYVAAASAAGASPSSATNADRVQVQMRNVALHVDEQTVVDVRRLRGEMIPTRAGVPAVFDDKGSFTVRIDTAEIAISTDSLSRLLNGYVFNYDGSPLKKLQVSTVGGQLKMTGTMKKGIDVPFTIIADARVDRNGALRLHPTSIKTLGIPTRGLFSLFGVELEKLVHVSGDRGVRVDKNDVVLDAARLLPPPRIEGRLQDVHIEPGRIVQRFGPGRDEPLRPPVPNTNYMYYRGGVLRFGRLTMTDADLQLIDQHPQDPFDFFQDRYNDQLVAGYSKNTPSHGLKVFMPDYAQVRAARGSSKAHGHNP